MARNDQEYIKKIYREVTSKDIEEFSLKNIFPIDEKTLNEFNTTTLYGFNVRMSPGDPITPIIGGKNKERNTEEFAKTIEVNIPIFFQEINKQKRIPEKAIREIQFSLIDSKVNISSINNINLKDINPADLNVEELKTMKGLIETDKNFAIKQKDTFFPKEEEEDSEVYFWISAEDQTKTINQKDSIYYLSNILVISTDENNIKLIAKPHHVDFLRFLFSLKDGFVKDLEIKSAIAAIMSRNMSHNLGSHVITNTKSRVIEIAEKSEREQTKELLGLASLLHYIQERQDFIAVVTGDEEYAKTGINFKAHVFDMLAYDGPAIRHQTSTTPQQKNFILDNIVRSENYDRNNVELILEIPNEDHDDPDEYKQLKSKQINKHSNDFNNIFLSIPYGINGRQGFLSILENFIRNSAKHDKKSDLHNLDFTIRIEDDKDDKNKKSITIYDNKGNAQDVIEKLKNIGLLDSNRKLRSDFLSITEQQSKHKFKGIKEMLICVAWLKGNHEYTEALDKPAEFLNIIDVDKNFGINFSLDKHSLVLNIDKKDNQNKSADIYYIQSDGIFEKEACKYPRLVKTEEGEEYSDTVEDFEILYEKYFEAKFGKLSNYRIYVIDERIIERDNNDETFCFISNGDIQSDDASVGIVPLIRKHDLFNGKINKNIIFKNHYETFGQDNDFEKVENGFYLEGISGANYTHSLLRNGNFDKMKAMRIIESCYAKILIVDERLYDKYENRTPKTEKPFTEEMIKKILTRKEEFLEPKYSKRRFNNVCDDVLKSHGSPPIVVQTAEQLQSDEQIKTFLSNFEIHSSHRKNYGDYFRGKNIDIADYNFKDKVLNFISDNPLMEYDFVSIHYGLIEKYAEQIGETDVKKALNRFIKKEINATKKKFISIHSGRGDLHKFKENGQSNITFIPLSGLEWVLENCKYTTTELFFSELYHSFIEEQNELNN